MAHQLTGKSIASTFEQLIYRSTTEPSTTTTTTQLLTSENDQTDDVGLPLYISKDRVGIGEGAPGGNLEIKSTTSGATSNTLILNQASNASNDINRIQFRRNEDAPDGDDQNVAHISAVREGGTSTALRFGSGSMADTLSIAHSGYVGINDTAPDNPLHVTNSDGTGVACLKLEQLDVDQPFIIFTGTTESGQTKSLTSDTTVGPLTGHFLVTINTTEYWVPFHARN